MNHIQLYNVAAWIPHELEFLETLSFNLWWCWNHDAIELFRRIDPRLWKEAGHNPIAFLGRIQQEHLERLAEDDGFLSHLDQVRERFEAEVGQSEWKRSSTGTRDCIAYFSLEYGIHESLRIYAGGLGCLAGDQLKSASDMGLPLVGVGLLYRQGYFQQYLTENNWQEESFEDNELHRMPIRKAVDASNRPVEVTLPLPEGQLRAAVWRMDVGRVPLFLLDANISENRDEFRKITAQLYDVDRQTRLRQELLLGIGGFRALTAMSYEPSVCHMNEGHAAFLSLGRIEQLMKDRKLGLPESVQIVQRTNVFTTHTPVPAGNEYFNVDMLKAHLAALHKKLGIDTEQVISWGLRPGKDKQDEMCMTILGLRMARFGNGVSKLHGRVERRMWGHLWPGRPEDEVPIIHVTNGIHVTSWVSGDNAQLFDKYLGPEWRDNSGDAGMLARVDQIPDDEMWRAHELGRSRLIRTVRATAEHQYIARNARRDEINQVRNILRHDALTIGFARRFAAYKRATLILKDPDRLASILTDRDRPVQIVFSGKAHPADESGKNLIRQVIEFARRANVRHSVVFLENYDIRLARYLVQGVDVWLNTPRRPQEASGTSGMKAAVNGVLNVSILDGWWDEAYAPDRGWAIGAGEEYQNTDYQDTVEAHALYNLLENEIVPRFYERPDTDIPSRWTAMMKQSIKMALARFTSHRMVAEYNSLFYVPAREEYARLTSDSGRLKDLVDRNERFQSFWSHVKPAVPTPEKDMLSLHVGDVYKVRTTVRLGEIKPDEVAVEVYYGPVDSRNRITESLTAAMNLVEDKGNGEYVFEQEVKCETVGRYGFTARVTPRGDDWKHVMPGFMTWADGT